MARNEAGLQRAIRAIPKLREEFWRDVNVPGSDAELNQSLEKAGRVADFFELAELMCLDALHADESAAVISATRTRRRMARRSATTRTTLTLPPGNTRAMARCR